MILSSRSFAVFSRLLALFLFCQSALVSQSGTLDVYQITKIIDRADYTFSNKFMYASAQTWINKTIMFRGTIIEKPVIIPDNKLYIQISGRSNNGDPINVVAYLDNPLPSPGGYGDNVVSLSPGSRVSVYGILQKPRDFVDESGFVRFLPTMDCLLLFDFDDRNSERPLWTSRTLKR